MTMGTANIQRRDSSTLKKAVEFEALITSEYAVLFNVAAKFYSNEADIYDVLQEAFERCWSAWNDGQVRQNLTGYIVTTIKHSAIERQRRDASCARLVERLIADPSQTQSYTSFDACYEMTERTETLTEVLSALEQLPTIYKTTVTLRIYVGLSERDVARELFIAQKTVRTRVNRGLQMLRTHLADVA